MNRIKIALTAIGIFALSACSDSFTNVTFTKSAQTAAESAKTITATVQLSLKQTVDVTVPFTVTGTAKDPDDYTITKSPVTIKAGATTATIVMTLVDDKVKESAETVILTMGDPTNADKGAITVDTATITDTGVTAPTSVAQQWITANGDMYIADTYNCVIRKVTKSTGIITTVAGNNAAGCGYSGDGAVATSAQLAYPVQVVVDSTENLYIADTNNCVIRKVAKTTGIITTVAGDNLAGCGFAGDGGLATAAQLNYPMALYITPDGDLIIGDSYNYRLRVITAANGMINTIAGTGSFSTTAGDGDGAVATNADINYIGSITMDADNNVYFGLISSSQIRKISSTDGILSTVAGTGNYGNTGNGAAATAADIGDAFGLVFDSAGTMYFADGYQAVVRKIDPTTHFINSAYGTGSGGYTGDGGDAAVAQLNGPCSLDIDSDGNIYFQESYNNTVRKVDATTNVISTVVGTGTQGYSGDGAAATAAELQNPGGPYWWD